MRELKMLGVRITRQCIIGGTHHEPGEMLEVDSNTYRQLLSDGLGVPARLDLQQIRPYEDHPHE
ncbi:MAG: hypothetical protein ACOY5S_04640 [Pseudomonadota bacterium]